MQQSFYVTPVHGLQQAGKAGGGPEALGSRVHSGNYWVQGPDTSLKLEGLGTKEAY